MSDQTEATSPTEGSFEGEKVVLHMVTGRLLKGVLIEFSPASPNLRINLNNASDQMDLSIKEVKAIFYVKRFSGNKDYREKRKFGMGETKGRRVMLRFKDGEILVGHVDRSFSLKEKAGSLSFLEEPNHTGFFLYPADPNSNNTKIFVVSTALMDARQL